MNQSEIATYYTEAFTAAAKEHSLFPVVETQAAAGFAMWQILLKGIYEAGTESAEVIEWLNANEVEALPGVVKFDGFNNYGTDFNRVTQIQDGTRVLVWPEDVAGAKIRYQP